MAPETAFLTSSGDVDAAGPGTTLEEKGPKSSRWTVAHLGSEPTVTP